MRLLKTLQRSRQAGATLVAILIGLTVGLIVLTGGIAFYVNNVSANRQMLATSRLDLELMSAMDAMAREIRRAQYIARAETVRHQVPCADVFCDGPEDFSLNGGDAATGFAQIELSYDRHDQGSSNAMTQNADECTGFRLRSQTIEMKTNCSADGGWLPLSDPATTVITELNFGVDCSVQSGFYTRTVHMRLGGHLGGDTGLARNLSESVQVRAALAASAPPAYCRLPSPP